MKFELNPTFRCLSALGPRLSAGTHGGSILAWDAATGAESAARTLGGPGLVSLVPTEEGRWLAADQAGTLWVVDASGARKAPVDAVHRLERDGSRLLTLGREAVLRDAASLDAIKKGPPLLGRPRAAAFSPVGTTIAVADDSLLLWRPEEGDVERRDLSCAFVAFVDHAALVVAGGEWVDVYDLAGGARRQSMRCFDGAVTCGWLDRPGKTVYVGTDRGCVVPFDLAEGRAGTPVPLWPSPLLAIVPIPGGLAALQERAVRTLSLGPLRPRDVFERHPSAAIDVIELSPASGMIASADEHSVRIWDAASGLQRAVVAQEQPWNAVSTSVSPDGSLLALAAYGSPVVRLIETSSGRETSFDVGAMAYQVRVAPSNRILGLLSTYDTIALISVSDRKQTVLPGQYRTFAFSRPTGLVAGITVDNTLRLFDYLGRNALFSQRQGEEVAGVEFSPDESCVGLLDYSSNVRAIDLETGREASRAPCPAPMDQIRFAIGESGKLIAIGTLWGIVQLWYDGRKLAEIDLGFGLRRMAARDGKLWCAGVSESGPESSPLRFGEAAILDVSYDALFAYRLSGFAPAP